MKDESTDQDALTRGQCILALLLLMIIAAATAWSAISIAPMLRG